MSMAFEDDTLDLMILAKRKPIVVCVKKIGLKKKELYIEDSSFWISNAVGCEWFFVGAKCFCSHEYI
jgi:hypothetical protein